MSLSYAEIQKSQETIEQNLQVIKKGFEEAENRILKRRTEILASIQQEQQLEAAKLAQISDALKSLIAPPEQV